jgi:hypothetical protein
MPESLQSIWNWISANARPIIGRLLERSKLKQVNWVETKQLGIEATDEDYMAIPITPPKRFGPCRYRVH